MNTKALRQKILDLAIRGKLVPQDPNDEPASILLERIRAEKQQMVKDGKLKAKDINNDTIIFMGDDNLHYEKFQDGTVKCIEEEIPFEVPKGWEWTRMASVCEFITSGSRGWAKYYADKGCLFIRMGNLSRDSFKLHMNNVQRVNLPSNVEGTRTRVLENDLLFSITAEIGMLGLIPINFEEAYINQHVGLIRFLKDTQTKYFPFILMSEFCKSQYYTVQSGMKNSFRLDNIQRILVPIPPFVEQKQIAKKIEDIWDTIVTIDFNAEYVERLVTQTKIKILDLAVRGQLVPQNSTDEPASALLERIRAEKEKLIKEEKIKRDKMESIIYKGDDNSYYQTCATEAQNINDILPFSIPDSWEWSTINQITTYIQRGKSPKYSSLEKFPVMAQKCNQWDGVHLEKALFLDPGTLDKYTEDRYIQKDDILINSTGTGTIGRVGIFKDGDLLSYPFVVADSHVTIIRSSQRINAKYVYYFFCSNYQQKRIEDTASGSTNQKEMYIDTVKSFIISLPPRKEQDRIVQYISMAFKILKQIEEFIS
jgi:type I restriction enzyme S subunit